MPSEFERLMVEYRKGDEMQAALQDLWLAGPGDHRARYPHVLALVRDQPWAILPAKLAVITDLLRFRAEGGRLTAEQIAARIGAATERPAQRTSGAVAVIPVYGTIVQRADMFTEMSGGTSTERISAAVRQAVDDPLVGSIVLDIDSPGGGVFGVPELADQIMQARKQKRVVAVANSMAASAAYWIASAASEIAVTPSGDLGSIGVFAAHEDVSRMFDSAGVTVSLISAGKYKTEGNPFEPLTDEAREAMQSRVNDYYTLFTKAVAKGRGVSIDAVRSGFGEGRVVGAQQAVRLGMADSVETLDAVISRLSGRASRANGQRAEAGGVEVFATGGLISEADIEASVKKALDLLPRGGLSDDELAALRASWARESTGPAPAQIFDDDAPELVAAGGLSDDSRRRRLRLLSR